MIHVIPGPLFANLPKLAVKLAQLILEGYVMRFERSALWTTAVCLASLLLALSASAAPSPRFEARMPPRNVKYSLYSHQTVRFNVLRVSKSGSARKQFAKF